MGGSLMGWILGWLPGAGPRQAEASLRQVSTDIQTPDSLAKLQEAAREGLAEAQYGLAVLYANGFGVTQDVKRACHWYLQAAKQGHVESQYDLAVMYTVGDGIQQDYGLAMQWFHRAAASGHAHAQNNLGIFYENGLGTKQDEPLAETCFAHAARNGSDQGWYNLGRRYMRKQTRETDVLAFAFLDMATQTGMSCQKELRQLRTRMSAAARKEAVELTERFRQAVSSS